jgi:hypothetical protein
MLLDANQVNQRLAAAQATDDVAMDIGVTDQSQYSPAPWRPGGHRYLRA